MRNKVITLNTRPDYRGTFKNQILEFRLGNTKFLFFVTRQVTKVRGVGFLCGFPLLNGGYFSFFEMRMSLVSLYPRSLEQR